MAVKISLLNKYVLVFCFFSTIAIADNGIIPIGNSVESIGMGGAALSNPSTAESSIDNPALLSKINNTISVGTVSSSGKRELDTTDVDFSGLPFMGGSVDYDEKNRNYSQIAFATQLTEKLNFGLSYYRAGNLDGYFLTGPVAEIRPEPQTVAMEMMVLAPTVSYAFSDNFSIGASFLIADQELLTRNLLSTAELGTGLGTSTGYGIKLGADLNVNDNLSLGFVIQSATKMSDIGYLDDFMEKFGHEGDSTIPLPNQIGVGTRYAFGEKANTTIAMDIMYYQWSEEDFYDFFGWDDQTVYKIGLEHQYNKFAFRLGYNYAKSPIQGGNRTNNDGTIDQSGAEVPVTSLDNVGDGRLDAAFGNYPFMSAAIEEHYTLGMSYNISKTVKVNAFYLYAPEVTHTATGLSLTPGGLLPSGSSINVDQKTYGFSLSADF